METVDLNGCRPEIWEFVVAAEKLRDTIRSKHLQHMGEFAPVVRTVSEILALCSDSMEAFNLWSKQVDAKMEKMRASRVAGHRHRERRRPATDKQEEMSC